LFCFGRRAQTHLNLHRVGCTLQMVSLVADSSA
jgi:hypothetical protein